MVDFSGLHYFLIFMVLAIISFAYAKYQSYQRKNSKNYKISQDEKYLNNENVKNNNFVVPNEKMFSTNYDDKKTIKKSDYDIKGFQDVKLKTSLKINYYPHKIKNLFFLLLERIPNYEYEIFEWFSLSEEYLVYANNLYDEDVFPNAYYYKLIQKEDDLNSFKVLVFDIEDEIIDSFVVFPNQLNYDDKYYFFTNNNVEIDYDGLLINFDYLNEVLSIKTDLIFDDDLDNDLDDDLDNDLDDDLDNDLDDDRLKSNIVYLGEDDIKTSNNESKQSSTLENFTLGVAVGSTISSLTKDEDLNSKDNHESLNLSSDSYSSDNSINNDTSY